MPTELAAARKLSDTKVRRMFQKEGGVLRIGEPSRRVGRKLTRRLYTMRVPETVARRRLGSASQSQQASVGESYHGPGHA